MKNTVLIVDDSPLYRDLLKSFIEKHGYDTELFSNGQEVMLRIVHKSDDLAAILLDIYMPEIDGISVLGHFTARHPDIPVIMISGSEDSADFSVVSQLGAAGYISKPIQPKVLETELKRFLPKIKLSA